MCHNYSFLIILYNNYPCAYFTLWIQLKLILSKMTCIHESFMYIKYSISDDIVMIHNFASNIIIIAQDMYIQYSISDDIVMIHNFASNIIIIAQDM